LNLLVLGPQGAGKGTQAKRIAAAYSIPHISTGDMFRAEIAAKTDFGKQLEPILASGALVPDAITISVIRERLEQVDAAQGFVLDGYPRTEPQADALDEMLGGIGRPLTAILFFDLPDDVATERMLARAQSENRPDDTPEVIAKRLATYHAETEPIVGHYRATGLLLPLHAERSIDEVYDEIRIGLLEFENAP
jgi:adenylate kinase